MVLRIFCIQLFVLMSFIVSAQKKQNSIVPDTNSKDIITIKGIVNKGVEGGCIILKTKDNKMYQLQNIHTELNYPVCLKVSGYELKNNMNICMQGTPFYVTHYCPCNKKSKPKFQRELPKDRINK